MIALVLSWVRKLTGLGGLAGGATIIVGVLVLIGGVASWLRDDALSDCNAKWQLQLAKKNEALTKANSAFALKVRELEAKLAEASAEADAARSAEQAALEKQREAIQLDKACSLCRVPNGHIWLRRDGADAKRGRPNS